MSQPEINSIENWESEELSEAELDALAGGRIAKRSAFSTTPTFVDYYNIFSGDVIVVPSVPSKVDSSYTSFIGGTGTSGNEASTFMKHIPLNLSDKFP